MLLLRAALTCLVCLGGAAAQVTDKPESWLWLGGQTLSDVQPDLLQAVTVSVLLKQKDPATPFRPTAAQSMMLQGYQRLLQAGVLNPAWRLGARLLASLSGTPPSEALELAIALDFHLDRGVVVPGGLLHARLEPLFRVPEPLSAPCQARFTLLDGAGKTLRALPPVELSGYEEVDVSIPAASLAPGSYAVRYELLDAAGKALVHATRDFRVDGGWRRRSDALDAAIKKLALAGVAQSDERRRAAGKFVEWVAIEMDLLAAGHATTFAAGAHPMIQTFAAPATIARRAEPVTEADIGRAEQWAAELASGGNPLATLTGSVRLAFLAGGGNLLEPYTLVVPPAAREGKPVPLLLALHGLPGNDRSWPSVEGFDDLAAARGYLVVSPAGRSEFSEFEGPDREDLLALAELVSKMFTVEGDKYYVLGMGGGAAAALRFAVARPGRSGAVAMVAGLPPAFYDMSAAAQVPVLLQYASDDPAYPRMDSRSWALLLARHLARFRAAELAGVDAAAAPKAALKAVFDFFDEARRPPAPKPADAK